MKLINTHFNKRILLNRKKSISDCAGYVLICIMMVFIQKLSAQEVFDNTATGTYKVNTQVANLYDLNLTEHSWQNDFKHSIASYKLEGSANTGITDRFGNPSQALSFQSYQNLIIPNTVIKDIVNNNKGFSISAWVKIPENGKDCQILSFTNLSNKNKEDIQLKIKDGYFQILKYSPIAKKMIVQGQTRYKISYHSDNTNKEIFPDDDVSISSGYIYFMLSSDQYATRFYFSRPGGRLYANYFWFGLSDILSDKHQIVFGTVNSQRGPIINAVDDIMVYKEMLNPKLADNHFLLQSPLYASRSYILRNYKDQPITPKKENYEDGYIVTSGLNNSQEAIYGTARWYMSTPMDNKRQIWFTNAKSYLPIARWKSIPFSSGNYFYQDTGQDALRRDFTPNHIIGNPQNLIDYKEHTFNFLIDEYKSEGYELGMDGNYLYVQNKNQTDDNWSVQGSFKTSVRERFSQVSEQGVQFINYATKQSMSLDRSFYTQYFLYLDSSKAETFSLEKVGNRFSFHDYDYTYGDENYRFFNMPKSGELQPSSSDNTRIVLDNPAKTRDDIKVLFQLIYVKDDPNGKPLYMIRLNNKKRVASNSHYVATILSPGYNNYVLNEVAEDFTEYPDKYLWSVNVVYDGQVHNGNSNGSSARASVPVEKPVQSLNVYPNPVKDVATVEYTLSQSGAVKLYITSATGALVKTIKEGNQSQGTYKESLYTSGWAAGVYLCTLEAEGQKIITKKIIVH
ncbi:T9SS type A sorting domain-containing protein [Chryseobacterium sp.]|uniref:T9SS type A sorting domain-containing protein n=1 Tax=Chryseobacterium sp. TaxID=1871047 RepID=UPI0025C2BE97|nr:T9SS type A sorting domain-containing protein [Chryseobacterium sp.]MBV8327306.1 T9SS type A sorting domain-containing protein [Chryseobacterium sp.]